MNRRLLIVLLLVGISGSSYGQFDGGMRRRRQRPMDFQFDRAGVPDWETDAEFPNDVFTFARLRYNDYGGWGKWATDYPDSDLNFSFRLQQLTSLKVNPDPVILDLDDPKLFDFPFIYIIEPGHGLGLLDEDVETLRRYIDNGGFVFVDDFWGEPEWEFFYRDIERVFPGREPVELPLDHPIFHIVYDLTEKPQIPSIQWLYSGLTYERHDAQTPHYRAYFDDEGGLQMIICHNTDVGDGWEREGVDERYFHTFSEKWAYPLGINILFYAMTH
ncbi:MAG: DUF4159 domain-containing protein [Planctomycetaceae bacterium]|nr:DUF4159 domain-containing protein [Planctomycetaceae bacterium]